MAKLKTWICAECTKRNEFTFTSCEHCGNFQERMRSPKRNNKAKKVLKGVTKKIVQSGKATKTRTSRFISQIKNTLGIGDQSVDIESGGDYVLSKDGTASTRALTVSNTYDTEEEYLCRMQDFKYAQQKRKESYGDESPWGILGLYEHLAAIRTDIEWADDVAYRKENNLKYVSWSEFDDTKKDGLNRPFFTYFIVIISTIMMFVELGKNGWKIEQLSINPMVGPSAETLISLGAKFTDYIVNNREYYRLFTPMFLHAGWIHFFLNMFAVYAIGTAIEIAHGTLISAVIFIASSVGGTILSALFLPEFISVGASGGIFGYIGACLADIILNWNLVFGTKYDLNKTDYCRKVSMVLFLLSDVAINCMIGMTPFVDNFTHMGGMFYGLVCGFAMIEKISLAKKPRIEDTHRSRRRFARTLIGCLIMLTTLKTSTIYLLTGDGITSPCSSCRYTSCVSFPPWSADNEKWWYCDNCGTTTADAQVGDDGNYAKLSLNCPDDTQVELDVSTYNTNDRSKIQDMLPFLCRDYCENIYF